MDFYAEKSQHRFNETITLRVFINFSAHLMEER